MACLFKDFTVDATAYFQFYVYLPIGFFDEFVDNGVRFISRKRKITVCAPIEYFVER